MGCAKLGLSILSADFANLKNDVCLVEKAGANFLHIDVMDGHFVRNISFGAGVVESLHKFCRLPIDVHLMVENPIDFVESFSKAGAFSITFHAESKSSTKDCINLVKKFGLKCAIAISPQTYVKEIEEYLDYLDMVLVMTVEPGFGGQKLILPALKKVEQIKRIKPDLNVQVDGGFNLENVEMAVRCGADLIVVGSAILKSSNCFEAVLKFRKIIGG